MKIIVNHIYPPAINKMHVAGWRVHFNKTHHSTLGREMWKEFNSIGDAIRDFEKITGFDAILDSDQDGCAVYVFSCPELRICVGGWQCGKYLYEKWCETPRGCLEAMNTK